MVLWSKQKSFWVGPRRSWPASPSSLREGRYPRELADLGILDYREVPIDPYLVIFWVTAERVDVLLNADGRRDMEMLLQGRLLQS